MTSCIFYETIAHSNCYGCRFYTISHTLDHKLALETLSLHSDLLWKAYRAIGNGLPLISSPILSHLFNFQRNFQQPVVLKQLKAFYRAMLYSYWRIFDCRWTNSRNTPFIVAIIFEKSNFSNQFSSESNAIIKVSDHDLWSRSCKSFPDISDNFWVIALSKSEYMMIKWFPKIKQIWLISRCSGSRTSSAHCSYKLEDWKTTYSTLKQFTISVYLHKCRIPYSYSHLIRRKI